MVTLVEYCHFLILVNASNCKEYFCLRRLLKPQCFELVRYPPRSECLIFKEEFGHRLDLHVGKTNLLKTEQLNK